MTNSRFKIGDRVVEFCPVGSSERRGVVSGIYDESLSIDFDGEEELGPFDLHQYYWDCLEAEEIYDSPLYKALNEK